MADNMSIDKKEPERELREGSDDSMDSTPEAETGGAPQENAQIKRKGGRKPIYATSEERKQRNRQAQAAFRERRTEYIKQLEETIRVHETNLHSLQTAHRSAADECLMLRYKNSLLERILLEKGIDVQAELRMKTGSPHLGPTHMPQNMAQPPTVQRAIMNRHNQARRPISHIAPKLEPGIPLQSPQSRPTPSSHASSPTSMSPGFALTPPASDSPTHHQHPHHQQPQPQHPRMHPAKPHMPHGIPGNPGLVNTGPLPPTAIGARGSGSSGSGSMGGTAAFYPTSFQNHYEQLEQEYDAQADAIEENDIESGPGPYPQTFSNQQEHQQQQQMGQRPPQATPQQQQQQQPGQPGQVPPNTNAQPYNSMTQLLDPLSPYDPIMDMDPFGLSQSMQFPTSFSFDTSSMR